MTQTVRQITENKQHTKPLLAFFGHHKAASSTIVKMLADICYEMCLKPSPCNGSQRFDCDLKKFVEVNKVDFLLYSNADYQYTKHLNNYKGFHVIRDPRDTLVSAYFSHLYSHPTKNFPELIPHREKLAQLSKNEGLIAEMDFSDVYFQHMYHWNYKLPNVLEIKMEDLFANSYENFFTIFDFLGILDNSSNSNKKGINPKLVKTINKIHIKTKGFSPLCFKHNRISKDRLIEKIDEYKFENLAKGRKRGQQDVKSHYRKGVPGDWKNHFTSEHIRLFKDRYNDLILKMGYESDPDWWKNHL